jgi:hypothetical protein
VCEKVDNTGAVILAVLPSTKQRAEGCRITPSDPDHSEFHLTASAESIHRSDVYGVFLEIADELERAPQKKQAGESTPEIYTDERLDFG